MFFCSPMVLRYSRSGCTVLNVKFDGRHPAIEMAARLATGQGGQSCAASVCGAY